MYPRTSLNVTQRFGAELKAARRRRGLTQVELAKLAGVDQTAVSRLEAGGRDPRLTTIVGIASALEIPSTDLIPD